MHSTLLIKAFKKAEEEIGSSKKTRIAKKLSDIIYEDDKQQYGEKILIINYNKIQNDSNNKIELKPFVLEALSHYLGYSNYLDFASDSKNKSIEFSKSPINSLIHFLKKNKVAVTIILLIFIGFLIFLSINKQRWMVWNNNQYIEVKFNAEKYNLGQLKLYNEDRIANFKKISVDCNTEFFDSSGQVKIWYGKNNKKELEYFSSIGLHPETSKSLDPITVYMIRKYICEDY